jgi:hypothetical protein
MLSFDLSHFINRLIGGSTEQENALGRNFFIKLFCINDPCVVIITMDVAAKQQLFVMIRLV